jgi:branched chain amino acid efflux pump
MNEWLLIFCMAAVTYLPRYLPFAFSGAVTIPPNIKQALEFVPIAVLTAIIAQSAIIRDGSIELSLANHHALAALAAFICALTWDKLPVTVIVGLAVFASLRLFG